MKPERKFRDYCKIEGKETEFVVSYEPDKAVCCTCSYTKSINKIKLK